jgi:hexosaminidase
VLDTARNYLPISSIKKTIDAMEVAKLNTLHWHITDGQSFPLVLQTKGLQILAEKGAYGPDMIYNKEMISELVRYGACRGVNIVPEIDMPGHMYEGVKEYPGDLITCGDQKDWSNWAAEPPSGHLDIRKAAATQFIKDLLSEVTTYLPGPYFSTGNDESAWGDGESLMHAISC